MAREITDLLCKEIKSTTRTFEGGETTTHSYTFYKKSDEVKRKLVITSSEQLDFVEGDVYDFVPKDVQKTLTE